MTRIVPKFVNIFRTAFLWPFSLTVASWIACVLSAVWALRPMDRSTLFQVYFTDGTAGYVNGQGRLTGKGRIILEADKTRFGQFDSCGVPVKIENRFGFRNRAGALIVPADWDAIGHFDVSGMAPVKRDGKWGYVNCTGAVAIPPQWDQVSEFDESGLALVNDGKKFGFIDQSGQRVIPPSWDYAWPFQQGYAGVRQAEKWGFIDREGRTIASPKWDRVLPFNATGLAVVFRSRKCGLIDHHGHLICAADWDEMDYFQREPIAVRRGRQWGDINSTGQIVIPLEWDEASGFDAAGMARVKKGDKFGFIDRSGKLAIPCQWLDASRFNEHGIAMVNSSPPDEPLGGGCIDRLGNVVVRTTWETVRVASNARQSDGSSSQMILAIKPYDPGDGTLLQTAVDCLELVGLQVPKVVCHLYDMRGRLIWSSEWPPAVFWPRIFAGIAVVMTLFELRRFLRNR